MRIVFALLAALALGGCGNSNSKIEVHMPASDSLSFINAAEMQVSTLANSLASVVDRRGDDVSCEEGGSGTARTAIHARTSAANTVSMQVTGAGELMGCATTSGPPEFSHWPPRTGAIDVLIHEKNHWGSSHIAFNSTPTLRVSFEQWCKQGAETYYAVSHAGISVRMEHFFETYPRVFNGSYTLAAKLEGSSRQILFDNALYLKRRCCHPISGRIHFDSRVLEFSEPCGRARFIDSLGREQWIQLAACSM